MKAIIEKSIILILISGFLAFGACKEVKKTNNVNSIVKKVTEENTINIKLLIGSWLDTSKSALHFSLLKNGTARSDNMTTLLYQKWELKGTKLILTAKSIGNGTSFLDEEIYVIKSLTKEKMILKNGDYLLEFVKKK